MSKAVTYARLAGKIQQLHDGVDADRDALPVGAAIYRLELLTHLRTAERCARRIVAMLPKKVEKR